MQDFKKIMPWEYLIFFVIMINYESLRVTSTVYLIELPW
jgi:hypothetical protein